MIYTGNSASGWADLEKKGAFLLIPVTMASTQRLRNEEMVIITRVFVAACLAATLYCLGHAVWLMLTGAAHQNFGQVTVDEFVRLNPTASMLWMNFSYITLASGIGLHPTYFGLYLSFCLLMLVQSINDRVVAGRKRSAAIALFAYFVVFILFLSSRIAIMAAIGISLSAVMMITKRVPTVVISRMAILTLVLFAIIYLNPVTRFRGLQEPATTSLGTVSPLAATSIEIRLSLLRLTGKASADINPWLGTGTGAGEDFLRAEGVEHGISNILDSYDPHNQFIYTFFELGAMGLIMLVAVFFYTFYTAWKRRSYVLTGFALTFLAVCLTESAFELQKGIVFFTFFGSLLLFHEDPAKTAAS